MPFVRVKSAVKTDPQHEFDVSTLELTANPDLYKVVDATPVPVAREATFKNPRTATKRAARPGEKTSAPAGADS